MGAATNTDDWLLIGDSDTPEELERIASALQRCWARRYAYRIEARPPRDDDEAPHYELHLRHR